MMSQRQIAKHFGTSQQSIQTSLKNIHRKLKERTNEDQQWYDDHFDDDGKFNPDDLEDEVHIFDYEEFKEYCR